MAEEKAKQNITLNIRDTRIPMVIDSEDEELYRNIAQLINTRLNLYFDHYTGIKADQEIFYYTMIDIALKLSKQGKVQNFESVQKTLSQLSAEIDEALK